MGRKIDARDVLDANGRTARGFEGEIVGHYRRTGPNTFDPYEYVSAKEGPITVYGGLKIQLEPYGALFRMRKDGRVIRVAWVPRAEEQAELGDSARARRERFLADCVESFDETAGRGAGAVIASKLR